MRPEHAGRKSRRSLSARGAAPTTTTHGTNSDENIRRQEVRRMDAHRLRHGYGQQTVCSAERPLRRQHLELQRQSIDGCIMMLIEYIYGQIFWLVATLGGTAPIN